MKFFLIALPLFLLGVSCERHEFSETKSLSEKHDAHAAGHAEEHGEKKADEHGH